MMETWVLIPPELSLVLTPCDAADAAAAGQTTPTKSASQQQLQQQSARVWTRVPVTQGRRWSPFQGTVRLGVMPSDTSFSDSEVSFGSSYS